jgi:hypothetical protein
MLSSLGYRADHTLLDLEVNFMNPFPPAEPSKTDEPLRHSLTSLEQAVKARTAGREYQWSASVADALDQVRAAMQSRPGLPLSGEVVDKTRPTLARQAEGLRRDFAHCLERTNSMHEELQRVSRRFAPKARSQVRSEGETVPDFTDIRRRAADLIDVLKHIRDAEVNLVFDSVNTDIGVGD